MIVPAMTNKNNGFDFFGIPSKHVHKQMSQNSAAERLLFPAKSEETEQTTKQSALNRFTQPLIHPFDHCRLPRLPHVSTLSNGPGHPVRISTGQFEISFGSDDMYRIALPTAYRLTAAAKMFFCQSSLAALVATSPRSVDVEISNCRTILGRGYDQSRCRDSGVIKLEVELLKFKAISTRLSVVDWFDRSEKIWQSLRLRLSSHEKTTAKRSSHSHKFQLHTSEGDFKFSRELEIST